MRLLIIFLLGVGVLGCEVSMDSMSCYWDTPIEEDCWNEFSDSTSRCGILTYKENHKVKVEWEDVNRATSVLFSWNSYPQVMPSRGVYAFQNGVDMHDSGEYVIPSSDGNDFYHCDKTSTVCPPYQEAANTGVLYLMVMPFSRSSYGRFKVSLIPMNKYIEMTQLRAVKDLWDTCCRPNYKETEYAPLSHAGVISDTCSWAIAPVKANNDYGWDDTTTNSCSEMVGITCDEDGYVIAIDLDNRGLTCQLPELFGDLSRLESLSIAANSIEGDITRLERGSLRRVNIAFNSFYGELPCWGDQITHINADYNNLSGLIPYCYAEYTSLEELVLSHNLLSLQPFPALPPSIESLHLRDTNLMGEVDAHLPRLHVVDISTNYLVGGLDIFFNSSYLVHADVSYNMFSDMPVVSRNVMYADFSNNHMSGDFVGALQSMSDYAMVDISNNHFKGEITDDIVRLLQKNMIKLSGNRFACDDSGRWRHDFVYLHPQIGHCVLPTEAPTGSPTKAPTALPTEAPTEAPTAVPSAVPVVSADENSDSNPYTYIITGAVIIIILSCVCVLVMPKKCYEKKQTYSQTLQSEPSLQMT